MRSEWRETHLGNVIELKRGYDLPQKSRVDGDVPVVSSSGVSGTHNVSKVKAPGVVTGRYGTLGKVFLMTEDFWPLNTTLYVKDFKGNDVRFISYFLRKIDYGSCSDKAAVPGVNRNHLHMISISLPPLPEQKAIAHILGTLDDRIELNRRMNETLEGMAQALFKSWFVDFDPVIDYALASGKEIPEELSERAEARAALGDKREPLPEAIRTLFPDEFTYSDEMGWIPMGWEVVSIDDIAKITSGKRPDTRFTEVSEHASIPLWGGNGPMAYVPEPLINEPILLTGRVGTLGVVFRINTPCWPSDNTLIIRVTHPSCYEYLFLRIQQIDFASLNRGSTQPLLTQTDLKMQKVLLPRLEIRKCYSDHSADWYRRIDHSQEESKKLATIRDTLLPKLLSGEIRIPDAEKIAEGVV